MKLGIIGNDETNEKCIWVAKERVYPADMENGSLGAPVSSNHWCIFRNRLQRIFRMGGGEENHPPADIENNGDQYHSLAVSIANRISGLRSISTCCSFYRVPNRLWRILNMAYTPLVVSIGPLHHGNEYLSDMEEHKWRFLWQFLEKTEVSLKEYIVIVKSRENEIRDCYADFISYSSDKFVDLILLDAVFIIEIMLRLHKPEDFADDNNPFFNKPRIISQHILPDLRLLENQIPFFIIVDIDERAKMGGACSQLQIPMNDLCQKFLKKHLLFLMRHDGQWEDVDIHQMKHFVDGLRKLCIPPEFMGERERKHDCTGFTFTIPTITELHHAGVRFEEVTKDMFSIHFEKKSGILKIPKLILNNQTEIILRNIIAFEQCFCKNPRISTFILLTRLVDTEKDIDLLVENDVIDRAIGDHADVLLRIKMLAHEVAVDSIDTYFINLARDLKTYCKDPRHKWLANLRHIYFNTPWTTISMIVATIFLLLTLTQNIFSILTFIYKM